MSRLLPQFYLIDATCCEVDGEFEGYTVGMRWGPIMIEIVITRRVTHA